MGGSPIERFEVFPYREEDALRSSSGDVRYLLRPTVDEKLERLDLEWTTKALIDTGSPKTIFDRGAGEALDIDFDKPRTTHYLTGRKLESVPHVVTMTLPPFTDLWWEAEVDFLVTNDYNLPFGLLGQDGFLDKWVVVFNYHRNYFVVEQIDEWEQRLPVDTFNDLQDRFPDSYTAIDEPWG